MCSFISLIFIDIFTFLRRITIGTNLNDHCKEDGTKKAKIGITIKKSPNSDRTFESRLLDQEFDNMSIKNKVLDIG